MRTTRVLSLSLPPDLFRAAERAAKKEGRTRSELFREALRRYLQEKEWRELRRYGAIRAQRLGIREADVDRLIQEHRAEQR
jgi:CopG family transcriptional regulator/antitoxin EndoAI